MEPVFIYYNNLEFKENSKMFTADFSDKDRLQGILFNKNKDYYLTSNHVVLHSANERN